MAKDFLGRPCTTMQPTTGYEYPNMGKFCAATPSCFKKGLWKSSFCTKERYLTCCFSPIHRTEKFLKKQKKSWERKRWEKKLNNI